MATAADLPDELWQHHILGRNLARRDPALLARLRLVSKRFGALVAHEPALGCVPCEDGSDAGVPYYPWFRDAGLVYRVASAGVRDPRFFDARFLARRPVKGRCDSRLAMGYPAFCLCMWFFVWGGFIDHDWRALYEESSRLEMPLGYEGHYQLMSLVMRRGPGGWLFRDMAVDFHSPVTWFLAFVAGNLDTVRHLFEHYPDEPNRHKILTHRLEHIKIFHQRTPVYTLVPWVESILAAEPRRDRGHKRKRSE